MILNVKFFLRSMILNEKKILKSIILKLAFFGLSDFETTLFHLVRFQSTFLQGVRFRIEYFKTCQILKVLLLQKFAKLSCVHQNRARFSNVLMYSMASVNQVIPLGGAFFTPAVINVTRRIKDNQSNPIFIINIRR